MDRSRSRSWPKRPKNRTGPDFQTLTSIVFFVLVSQYSTRVDGYGSGYIRVRVAPGTIIGTRTRTRPYPAQKPGRVSIPVAITSSRYPRDTSGRFKRKSVPDPDTIGSL